MGICDVLPRIGAKLGTLGGLYALTRNDYGLTFADYHIYWEFPRALSYIHQNLPPDFNWRDEITVYGMVIAAGVLWGIGNIQTGRLLGFGVGKLGELSCRTARNFLRI